MQTCILNKAEEELRSNADVCHNLTTVRESLLTGISNYFFFLLVMASYLKFSFLSQFSCVTSLHGNIIVTSAENTTLKFPSKTSVSQVMLL